MSKQRSSSSHSPAAKKQKTDTENGSMDTQDDDFVFPSDWPKDGPIDLETADLPHDSSNTEWWYVNGHVNGTAKAGGDYSFFASFFKLVVGKNEDGTPKNAYALNWAIVDVDNKKYYGDPLIDRSTPGFLKKQLEAGEYDIDKRLEKALLEIVEKNEVPLPDHMFEKECTIAKDHLFLDYGGHTFTKDKKGVYHVKVTNKEKGIALDLKFTPKKQPQRQAHNGIVKVGIKQETMFYYYIPRNECSGTMTVNHKKINVKGECWYDHEFGGMVHNDSEKKEESSEKKKPSFAWNWFSCQLDDGSDITATNLVNTQENKIVDNYAVDVDINGERVEYLSMELTPRNTWVSIRTTNDYPTKWSLSIPDAKVELEMDAVFDEQEFVTLISKPGFWEGRLNIKGTRNGKPITGKGFIERHGFTPINSLDKFFKRVSKEVLFQVERMLPTSPTYEEARELIASKEFEHFMDGVRVPVFTKTIIEPLRQIIDRGGKSWRSFACLLCIDCVGGDSNKYKHWLAMPEIMHVGSLIVDDIQDKSETRRGGPSAHLIHGDATAINAGTAAYFLSLHTLQLLTPDLTDQMRLRIYEIYFLTLRAGHAGQAFDIYGQIDMMDEVVKTGNATELERCVLCTHRLKSAVPAGCLARMGATIGGGSDEQIEKIGMYFESIGLAFQIIDDVLNLRGFEKNVKTRGEDINAGKVTFPVTKAMSRLGLEERKSLWETISSKPQDQAVVDHCIDVMEKCGAIDASVEHAEKLVNDAWTELDAAIPASFYKMMLRAFGWYVLQRHY